MFIPQSSKSVCMQAADSLKAEPLFQLPSTEPVSLLIQACACACTHLTRVLKKKTSGAREKILPEDLLRKIWRFGVVLHPYQ